MTPAPDTLSRRYRMVEEYLAAYPKHTAREALKYVRLMEAQSTPTAAMERIRSLEDCKVVWNSAWAGRPREGDLKMERVMKVTPESGAEPFNPDPEDVAEAWKGTR